MVSKLINRLLALTFILLLPLACNIPRQPSEQYQLAPTQQQQWDLVGTVVTVTDGDTLKIIQDDKKVRIRLYGIDAPEKKQPYGPKAKEYLTTLTLNKTVSIDVVDTDRYRRKIGKVYLPNGVNINHKLVEVGMAWWFQKFAPNDTELKNLQEQARKRKAGLWQLPNPVPPWEYRNSKK